MASLFSSASIDSAFQEGCTPRGRTKLPQTALPSAPIIMAGRKRLMSATGLHKPFISSRRPSDVTRNRAFFPPLLETPSTRLPFLFHCFSKEKSPKHENGPGHLFHQQLMVALHLGAIPKRKFPIHSVETSSVLQSTPAIPADIKKKQKNRK